MLRHACEQIAGRVVDIDDAESLTGDFILAICILFPVSHEDAIPDGLDSERRVTRWKSRIDEGARGRDQIEVAVKHIDPRIVKVGGVEAITSRGQLVCEPFVDRALGGAIGEDYGLVALRRMPSTNLAGFCGKDEERPARR